MIFIKVLFLYASADYESNYFSKERNKVDFVECKPLFRKSGFIRKLILFLGYYVYSPLLWFVYEDWKKDISQYDIFIVPSRRASKYAVQYLTKHTNKRVIVWYWNIVSNKELSPSFCKKNRCEVWSFDKNDCIKYQMKFGDTYYFDFIKNSESNKPKKDVFFIGADKPGRIDFLKSMQQYCEMNDISFDLNLTTNPEIKPLTNYPYSKRLYYSDILTKINNCNCILDLNQPNQSGLSLRPLEALYFKKKLVTNNKQIKSYKAYDQSNTFILNDENFDGLAEFIKAPYVPNDNNIFEFYKFENWLYRICNEIEAY